MTEIEPANTAIVLRPRDDTADPGWTDTDYSISTGTAEKLLSATPEGTRRVYEREWREFEKWCLASKRVPLPATPQTLTEYVRKLSVDGHAPVTISKIIGAIRSMHRRTGYKGQPDTDHTLELLRGYKREWADEGGRARQATPILIDALRAMVETCDDSTAGLRDRSLLLLGFNAMCRPTEVCHFNIGDLADAEGEGLNAFIRYSKTDKEAVGTSVSIPFGQHAETCAVRAARAWIEELAAHGITDGPLYRSVDKHGRVAGEPLHNGIRAAAERLTEQSVTSIVRRHAVAAGLPNPQSYSGHSLRSGAATAAYLNGAPISEIATQGRWSLKSPVLLGYIRAVDKWKNNPMKGIGL